MTEFSRRSMLVGLRSAACLSIPNLAWAESGLAVVAKEVVYTLPGCEAFDAGVRAAEILAVGLGFDGVGSFG